MAGDKDLDLLVAREDQHRAEAILTESGFKRFASIADRDHPAVSSYLGFDEPSGRIVHLHIHLRLVVGERLLKSYRLPWENKFLSRAIRHSALGIRILDPAAEALILMVRACLELTRWDPITLRSWTAARRQYAQDLAALAASVPLANFSDLATEVLGSPTSGAMSQAFATGAALRSCRGLRRVLIADIDGFRLYGSIEARIRSIGRSLLWAGGRLNKYYLHAPRPWSRRAPGGGCVIAVVGLDGSGKSTAVQTLRQWLMTEIDVIPIYFGTGEGRPSLILLPFKLLLPIVEPLVRQKPTGSSHGTMTKQPPGFLYSTLMTIWATVVAAEKRHKLIAAQRAANRGMVVVADRYPQNENPRFNDGPLLSRLPRAPDFLRKFERATYARAHKMPPDLVLKLVVTPATAARREPAMDCDVIRERVVQLRDLTFGGARVVSIDAEQPLDAVIRTLKREVWATL